MSGILDGVGRERKSSTVPCDNVVLIRDWLARKKGYPEGNQKTGPRVCPACGQKKGKLMSSAPDPAYGPLGFYIYNYTCEGCGHTYENEYKW